MLATVQDRPGMVPKSMCVLICYSSMPRNEQHSTTRQDMSCMFYEQRTNVFKNSIAVDCVQMWHSRIQLNNSDMLCNEHFIMF